MDMQKKTAPNSSSLFDSMKNVNDEELTEAFANGEDTEEQEINADVMPIFHAAVDVDYPDVSSKLRRLRRYGTI